MLENAGSGDLGTHRMMALITWQVRQLLELQSTLRRNEPPPSQWRNPRKLSAARATLRKYPLDPAGILEALARGLGDEYYRMLTAEHRVLSRNKHGVMTSRWVLVEPTRRNEALDTMNYAEAGAMRKGWSSMTDDQWDALDAARGAPPPDVQPDLFDASVPLMAVAQSAPTKHRPKAEPASKAEQLAELLRKQNG